MKVLDLIKQAIMIDINDICEPEWVDWYLMTPEKRWNESAKLWQQYLAIGGSLDPEPDTQSPFYDEKTSCQMSSNGGTGLCSIRRSRV